MVDSVDVVGWFDRLGSCFVAADPRGEMIDGAIFDWMDGFCLDDLLDLFD